MAKSPRYRRWTADTETAFLMALRVTGSVTKACAEIGRSTSGAYFRRQHRPEFDARYHQVLDEWQAEQAAERRAAVGADDRAVMPNRVRYDGFTPVRQRAFLRVLSETGSVEQACRHVGISKQAALKARRTYPSFAAAWDRAETHCAADLEQIAIERAIDGIEQQVAVGGQLITRTVYPERLMTKMIDVRERRSRDAKAEKAKSPGKGVVYSPVTKEETDVILLKRLAAIDVRNARLKADAEARVWAAWQATWGSFGRGGLHLGEVEQELLPPLTPEEEAEMEELQRV